MDGPPGLRHDDIFAAPSAALVATLPHAKNSRLANGYRPLPQEGESALGITRFDCCAVPSFSGTINVMGDYPINAAHVNGRQPG